MSIQDKLREEDWRLDRPSVGREQTRSPRLYEISSERARS